MVAQGLKNFPQQNPTMQIYWKFWILCLKLRSSFLSQTKSGSARPGSAGALQRTKRTVTFSIVKFRANLPKFEHDNANFRFPSNLSFQWHAYLPKKLGKTGGKTEKNGVWHLPRGPVSTLDSSDGEKWRHKHEWAWLNMIFLALFTFEFVWI